MKNWSKWSVFVFLCIVLAAGTVLGQGKFPEKPVTLIVHASAGGGSDIFARTLA
jgi:tripartite-type tricarboxylate transporter receptor subunit TctC